eukprot:g64763.t1
MMEKVEVLRDVWSGELVIFCTVCCRLQRMTEVQDPNNSTGPRAYGLGGALLKFATLWTSLLYLSSKSVGSLLTRKMAFQKQPVRLAATALVVGGGVAVGTFGLTAGVLAWHYDIQTDTVGMRCREIVRRTERNLKGEINPRVRSLTSRLKSQTDEEESDMDIGEDARSFVDVFSMTMEELDEHYFGEKNSINKDASDSTKK